MAPVDNFELQRYRDLPALEVLLLLATYVKVDRDFKPLKAKSTLRVHVYAGDADWELLVDGPRFFDTRAGKGGGGAIDLVMHLWRVPFRKAVAMLREAQT
ncbi:hypothetical protein OKW45_005526 [Paraburkholderia sp. WSM4175]|uniref:hypothetical protein n=1 Tax=Paraburkholderia sp. WSM4175 TaxID=2991072 RepID=UPI003D21BAD0